MTITLNFKTLETDASKQFIYDELERLSPYMKRIITAFHDLNWGEHVDNLAPEVRFTIPLAPYHDGVGPLGKVRGLRNVAVYALYSVL